MKKIIFNILLLVAITHSTSAQKLIAVQNGGTPTFYTTLDAAISNANSGDTLYIPGGSFIRSSTIDKKLIMIGAGFFEDSAKATDITIINDLAFGPNASGGYIEGLYINGSVSFSDNMNGFVIKKCHIGYNTIQIPTNSKNISVIQSILGSIGIGGSNNPPKNIYISNCLILGYISIHQSIIQNNIFFSGSAYIFTSIAGGTNYSTIKNNIFYSSNSYSGGNNSFNNNIGIYSNGVSGTNYGNGNMVEPWDNTFINSSSSKPFDYPNNDFHLKSSSIGKNAGTDGTDIGIYGGVFPWKEGSVPFNPHIQSKQIAPTTTVNGNLKVNIKVKAQDR